MRLSLLLSLALALTATGCPPAEAPSAAGDAPAPTAAASDPSADAPADAPATPATGAVGAQAVTGVHEVACGCSIEAVGHCGEYAKVGGEFVEITGDLGLGDMPFCGKSGLKAELQGELHDGKLVATSLKLVP